MNFMRSLSGLQNVNGFSIGVLGFNAGANWENNDKSLNTPLNILKDKVNEILKGKDTKTIVIIDDIDRLMPDEMVCIFKLIKAVCDFNNVIYVVSFDKEVVINALNQFHNEKGKDYLEKIVQIPFEMPQPDQNKLNKMFFETKRL